MSQTAAMDRLIARAHPASPPVSARSITRGSVAVVNAALLSVMAAGALSVLGVIAISTTEPGLAMRQAVFLAAGLVAAAVVALPHYGVFRSISYLALAGVVALLVFVLLPFVPDEIVRPRNGARRWINLGVTDFQPSELAKIAFVLALANYLRFRENHRRLFGLFVPFALTMIPMGLILIEPDLGTALLFLPTLFAMLIAAGARKRHIALIIVLGLSCAPAMYPFLQPHQKDRIKAMIAQATGDTRHRDDIGFQADRAMTLVAAGQWSGVGRDTARDLIRYNALPEEHNDMIFAVITLRWGLIGAVFTVGLYLVYITGGLVTAALCREPFGRLIAVGCVSIIFAQMSINIGMTIGLLPITGMTLPFVSYGGSSLLALWLSTGLLYNIAMRRPRMLEREPFDFDDDPREVGA